jgi:hypothetical protein
MACPAQEEIELRCNAGKLLAVMLLRGEQPSFVKPDNLIELPCSWCRDQEKRRGLRLQRVVHRFDLSGALIETLIQR